jgi:hypothetical protein
MVDAGNQNPATCGLHTLKDLITLRETRNSASCGGESLEVGCAARRGGKSESLR